MVRFNRIFLVEEHLLNCVHNLKRSDYAAKTNVLQALNCYDTQRMGCISPPLEIRALHSGQQIAFN